MAEALPLIAHLDLESQIAALKNDGYVYFPGVVGADEIAELRVCMDRLEPIAESFDLLRSPESGGYFERSVNNAFNRDALFLQYLDKPGVIELAEAAHGSECHVIAMTAWITGPGRPDQRLHVDWLPMELPEDVIADPRVKVPIFVSTAHFYLDDLYEELGPTKIVPGSHRAGRAPDGDTKWNGTEEHSVLCKAGDVVLFRCEVWHRGSANTSDQRRYLLQVHYANRMVTQKFPPYLNMFRFDEGLLAQATPRQRRLLGEHDRGAYD